MLFPKPGKSKKGNTKRIITKETKHIVYQRDGGKCVLCKCYTQDEFHHIHFGGSAIYTENRNDPDQLCLLCHQCHTLLHFDGNSNHYREECIEYVKNYYFKKDLLNNYRQEAIDYITNYYGKISS